MGRLFWKFFFSFWLTLLITAVSVGSFVWLKSAAKSDDIGNLKLLDYHASSYVAVATDIATHQGETALKNFIEQLQSAGMTDVFVVNNEQRDILGRKVDLATFSQARQLFDKGKRRLVEQVFFQDTAYLLYAPLAEPEPLTPHFKKRWVLKHLPLLLMIGSVLFASLLFSALLAWYFTRPIRHLKQAFSDVAQGKLDTRVATAMGNRQDELAELGNNFDFMASKISALVNGQRHLLHDVSHELRSPLARMQAAIGIAQQQPDKVPSTLARLERESERISDLVGELLLISRMETGVEHSQASNVDMAELIEEIVDDARFEADNKAVSIDMQSNADISLHGHQELLHRAIENLIRNAIKFSEPGHTVQINSHHDKSQKQLRITVEDQGTGVTEADLKRIFRPFFRASHSQRQDGIGLGLTIAQQAVTAHHGHILAENRAEGGLRMVIILPNTT